MTVPEREDSMPTNRRYRMASSRVDLERAHLHDGDASGQRVARLADQVGRAGSGQEEAAGFMPRGVHDAPQLPEQPRIFLGFVDDDAPGVFPKEEVVVPGDQVVVGGVLQVEVPPAGTDHAAQRRLAGLSRPDEHDHREHLQQAVDALGQIPT
jgi:hypothetical protein